MIRSSVNLLFFIVCLLSREQANLKPGIFRGAGHQHRKKGENHRNSTLKRASQPKPSRSSERQLITILVHAA